MNDNNGLKEKESNLVEEENNFQNNKLVELADDAKEVAEKAKDLVEDAAKVVGDFAGKQVKNAKNIFEKVSKNLDEGLSKRNLEKYQPFFVEDLERISSSLPQMINVVNPDKRLEIEECKGALGYQQSIKGTNLIDIYVSDANKLSNIVFYPDKNPSSSVYYVHPIEKNKYIEITEYFKYLKEQRVTELENIAQDLGAKHFEVKIMEESLSNEKSKTKGGAMLGFGRNKASVDVGIEDTQKKYEYIGIAATNRYPGKEPKEPKLELWANNESIKNLVKQRLSSDNPLQSKTFRLDYNTSSGIKEKEAAKIDGVLKVLKFKAAGSIEKEAQKESKRRLEYTIEF